MMFIPVYLFTQFYQLGIFTWNPRQWKGVGNTGGEKYTGH